MSDASPLLGLPYILPAQAQKHVTHNEAIRALDALVQLAVADRTRTSPPPDPAEGDRHLVAAGATGAWAGQDGKIAVWAEDAGWVFLSPRQGWLAWVEAEALLLVRAAADWAPVLSGSPNFARVGVNAVASDENRLSVSSPATLLNHEGAGHQVKVNKAAATDTASLLFQTGFSGRAEMGTAGSDDFSIKVSPDGSTWFTALTADRATGQITAPGRLSVTGGTVTAPGLAFAGDTDTGLFAPAADALGLAAGGAERARVTSSGMQVTGLITGTAVTQSPTDATAGRLLKVGDFGLGLVSNAPPTVADLDDATLPSGFYRVTQSGTTAGTWPPSMSATGGYLMVRRYNVDNVEQTLARQGVTTHGMWRRLYITGTWQPWQLVGLQVLGTVSQTAGTPTGALWQGNAHEASPANGYFERSANGFQTCQHTITSSASGDSTWTFPAAFLSGSTPQISVTPVGDSDLRSRVVSRSATSVVFSIRDGSGARVAVPVDLIARGRWSAMA